MINDFQVPNRPKQPVLQTPSMPAAEPITPTTPEDLGPEPLGLDSLPLPEKPPKKPRRSLWRWFKARKLWQKMLLIVLILALLGGAAFAYVSATKEAPTPEPQPVAAAEAEPEPTTAANTLTGREVALAVNETQVTGVMIENSRDARPQSGLYDAGVVFEAIAEGGITRFLALYQDTEPESLGPIRSVRPYYLEWALGFDAAVAHVGGSAEALQNIKTWGVKDLDQGSNPSSFTRVTSRYAPHNVYSSIPRLQELEAQKGFNTTNFNGFGRKADKAAAEKTAATIDINISSALYRSSYTYDAATNSYLRNLADEPHTDEGAGGKQINPKVVIGLVTDYSIHSDGIHSVYRTTGSGQAYIFQDGAVTIGTWNKIDRASQITFTDATGKTIGLNAGQTWITAVSAANKITYGP